jgi:single-strand DNA-binding protein
MSANISILGNLGRAPETQTTSEGTVITKFSIASNSVKRTPQGTVEQTDWFRVTAFGKQAETLAKYAKRGSRLHVQGQLSLSAWRDRQDRPQYSADLLLQDFQFAGGNSESEKSADAQAASDAAEHSVETEIALDVQEIAQPAGAY